MSKEATFQFKGKDNVSEALKVINSNVQKVTKATKNAAKAVNAFNLALTVVKATVNGIIKVVSFALNTIINLAKAALRTLKNIITGAFNFIKTAISTLLSWITKALGKIFDGVKNILNGIFNFAKKTITNTINIVKKGIRTIIDSVQDYADKQYNEIQLKVSLGDSYDAVMKSYKDLLQYTRAGKNDLLSVYATFAEVGKKPEDVLKYARATVYIANATGQSLDRIARLFLRQEAAGSDLEKTLKRIGITISGQEDSISNIDAIIKQLGPEMEALKTESLSQAFANVSHNITEIKEQLGYIFAYPIQQVTNKLNDLLTKLIGSNKITSLVDKVNNLFTEKIEPVVDKIFEFLEKFIMDPVGFFKAIWLDIKQIGENFMKNLGHMFQLLGEVFALSVRAVWKEIQKIDFSGAFGDLKTAVDGLLIGLGKGFNLWSDEDIKNAEGSFKDLLIGAWNKAHPEFTLSKDDKWYTTLSTLLKGLLEDIDASFVEYWNGTKVSTELDFKLDESQPWYQNLLDLIGGLYDKVIKPKLIDPFTEWLKGDFVTIMGEIFTWLGQVLSSVFTNLVLNSDALKKVMSALGMPIVSSSDRDKIYSLLSGQGFLGDMSLDDFRKLDLNSNHPDYKYSTWADMIDIWGKSKFFSEAEGDLIRRLGRAGEVIEEKEIPTFQDLADAIDSALHPVIDVTEKMGPLTDALKGFREVMDNKVYHTLGSGFAGISSGIGTGGGGIVDLFDDFSFRIKPYSEGGPVTGPTLALLGEEGEEYVLSNKMLKGLVKPGLPSLSLGYSAHPRTTGGGGINAIEGWHLNDNGKWVENDEWYEIAQLLKEGASELTEGATHFIEWFDGAETLPDVEEKTPYEMFLLDNTWIDKIGRKIIRGFDYFFSGDWVDDMKNGLLKGADSLGEFLDNLEEKIESLTWRDIKNGIAKLGEGVYSLVKQFTIGSFKAVGFLAQNGAFGSHIGNIWNQIVNTEDLDIWKAIMIVLKEFLPYLQKGLEVVGSLFDEAFDILGNVVQILGERLGKQLLPILEAFVPLMKMIGDILIALAPVAESILKPAVTVIAAILRALVPILDMLMPAFAGIGAVIQWVSDAISWVIGSLLNWLSGIHIGNWYPFAGAGGNEVKRPTSIKENYNNIMDTYNAARAASVTGPGSSTSTASQTASYNGAAVIHIHNDFSGSYVIGNSGFRELALIIKNTLEDIDYSGQSV